MTYPLIVVPFVAVTVAVVLLTARRPRFRQRMTASTLAAGILVILTAVFDNVMIASGLFAYSDAHISGLRLGLAPVEDFAYPLAGVILLPALWYLFGSRRAR